MASARRWNERYRHADVDVRHSHTRADANIRSAMLSLLAMPASTMDPVARKSLQRYVSQPSAVRTVANRACLHRWAFIVS